MNSTRKWNFIGLVLGVILVVIGVLFILTPNTYLHTSRPSIENVTFNGDFYTRIYAEAKGIMGNTWTTANNVHSLVEALALYVGSAFVMWGLLTIVQFGKTLVAEGTAESNRKEIEINQKPKEIY